jgi:hypothetical protein
MELNVMPSEEGKIMKAAAVVLALALFLSLALIHMVRSDASPSSQGKTSKKPPDEYRGPIVDYDSEYQAAAVADPKERALREARGRRYNQRAPQPLGELPSNWEDFGIASDWYIGLPSLPVAQSDAVVSGEMVAAQAHISIDQTGVYSEFNIRIDEVLKNDVNTPLHVGDITVGEREGGVVRFQTGRLLRYVIYHQGMPSPGRHYLFFLGRNKQGEDYTIITAYELRNGRTIPLDESKAFASYRDSSEQEFLDKVREAIAHDPRPPGERKEESK